MFKNLRTSTKLLLLCGVFVGALVVATYSLVAEKQIAIQFVRKELVGVATSGTSSRSLRGPFEGEPRRAAGRKRRERSPRGAGQARRGPQGGFRTTGHESARTDAPRGDRQARFGPGSTTSSGPPSSRRLTRRATSHRGSATTPTSRSIRTLIASTSRTSSSPKYLPSSARLETSSLSSILPSSAQAPPETLAVRRLVLDGLDPVDPRRDRAGFAGIVPRRQRRPASANPRGGGGCHGLGLERLSRCREGDARTPATRALSTTSMRQRSTARSRLGR